MIRLLICASIAASMVAVLVGREDAGQQFRTSTDVVTIDVSVTRRNAPVAGLTAGDFELLDNGMAQPLTMIVMEEVPVDVTLVVAQTSWMQQVQGRLPGDLSKAVARLRPADRLRVITFASYVRELLPMQSWSRWPAEPARADALERLLKAEWPSARRTDSEQDPTFLPSSLYDALLLALARPAEIGRRHLVVAIALGVDSYSVLADAALLHSIARRTDALMHVVLWRPRVGGEAAEFLQHRYSRLAIASATDATGGALHEVDPIGVLRRILDNYRKSYLLQYTLIGVPAPGWHDVVVRTPKFPNYTVRAREGYQGR